MKYTKQYEKFASSCASRFEGQRPGQTLPAIGGETLFNKTLFPSTNQVARGGFLRPIKWRVEEVGGTVQWRQVGGGASVFMYAQKTECLG